MIWAIRGKCDQMARLFFIIWIPTTSDFMKSGRSGFKFCQTLNKPSKVCLRFIKVCPSGKISPGLVTLFWVKGEADDVTVLSVKQYKIKLALLP